VVSRRLVACLAVAAFAPLAGCELVVEDGTRVLASTDAGGDVAAEVAADVRADTEAGAGVVEAGPPVEAAVSDARTMEADTPPDCSSCVSAALSCQQACAAAQATCMSDCKGEGPSCSTGCAQQGMTCNDGCSGDCDTCFMRASCAGSNACPH
jgi:hypothetical protein